ncbi:hypothetical protein [Candidatus Methanoprimaticola sp. MG2]|uniref:hypothetical protein n=1 Tax=Candidatus Methanoprimaticola sp. MG2 TaxID=3228838 RepID=UPI0039C66BE6
MSKSPVPSLEDIRKIAELPVFVVEGDIEWMEGPVLVNGNDIESTLDFAKAVDAKVLFIQYDYPDFDDYFIDDEDYDLEELFGDAEGDVLNAIEERNDDFEDFLEKEYDNEPIGCSVYVMYEGTPYGMFVEDDQLIESFGELNDEFIVRTYMELFDEE